MSRTSRKVVCNAEGLQQLEALIQSKKSESRAAKRARMVLACLNGEPVGEIADRFRTSTNTVIAWRDRFVQSGVYGLTDMPRSGRPVRYTQEFRETVLRMLDTPPADRNWWSCAAIAKTLGVSDDAVSRLLRKEGIQLGRRREQGTSLGLV
ncbi:MAG: helix-turn-helix domain-containing protein [Magnetococcales bacterium]|nr:helix-turn-helix domain-containing protein [Magnetococcales bacterium]